MPDRILDFSESAAFLRVRLENLIIERHPEKAVSVPLEEVAVVVASHPNVVFTNHCLAELASHGAALVACDRMHQPQAMLLPLIAHSNQQKRFVAQTRAPLPLKKRLWQQVVRTKIAMQAEALRVCQGEEAGLRAMAGRVRSGDPDNVEAQAARRYWPALFGKEFRRDREAPGVNALLNYGYAVLRACVARAVCAAGLHPTLALHHANRDNPFGLADDLMEPYRPLIDVAVFRIKAATGGEPQVDKATKADLLAPVMARYPYQGESRTLFDWLASCATSLAAVFLREEDRFFLPELPIDAGK